MNRLHTITIAISIAVSAGVLVWLLSRGVDPPHSLVLATFVLCGLQYFMGAIALARGAVEPGREWGFSASARALLGIGWLSSAVLLGIARVASWSIPWPLAVLPGIALLIGFLAERRARVHRKSI